MSERSEDLSNTFAFPCAAFGPSDDMIHQYGMTFREYVAVKNMAAIIKAMIDHKDSLGTQANEFMPVFAELAVLATDALIAELSKK